MEVLKVGGLERNSSTEHGEEEHSQRPDVHKEPLVALIDDDFWGKVSRSATLFLDHLSLANDLRNTEVANLYSLLAVQEDVIQLYISVDDGPAMDVSQPVGDLFENELGIRFLQFSLALDQSQQVTTASILHHHQEMLARLEHFEQTDDIRVLDLLQEVDLLEHLPLAEVVLHVSLFDSLNSHLLASELMNSKSDFSEGTFTDKTHELVEVEGRRRKLIVLFYIRLYVLDKLVSLLNDSVIDLGHHLAAALLIASSRRILH